jgi:hypothetical protein
VADTATRDGAIALEIPTVDALIARLADRGITLSGPARFGTRLEEQALQETGGGYSYEATRRDGQALVEVVGPYGTRAPLVDVLGRPAMTLEWGYGGGPTDLARCLVEHRYGRPDPLTARALLADVVSVLPADGWRLTGAQLDIGILIDRVATASPPVPITTMESPGVEVPGVG